ncbi:MAG: SLC13 family permease [Eubacteriales bacterium]|nr:SLC13 family permease [Eubacteriales bacterium]MDD3073456.1 SLC13 family permease [Eubacteriales bacterium]MDD4078622.1 SLC13 family permease [Eubacteriales bacterium]MDD4769270.1 SLC13 family permease [Eubacteriales bacterium]
MGVLVHLLIAVAIMVFLMAYLKLNAAIGLVVGSLYLGIASGLGLVETVSTISSGFGGLMTGIGLPIAFGIMIGKLVADYGGVESIANGFLKGIKKKENTPWAMTATGFLASIPVFYDVVFVIVSPIAKGLSKVTRYPLPYYLGALVAGAGIAHCFILPTPGPLAGAEILGIPIGQMFVIGAVIGAVSAVLTYYIYKVLLDKKVIKWDPEKDEEQAVQEEVKKEENVKLPSFILSIIPIILPIIMILFGTVYNAFAEVTPAFVQFMSNRVIALLAGAIVAIIISWSVVGREKTNKSLTGSLAVLGTILLITGAGGSFAAVINASGSGASLTSVMTNWNISPLLFVWVVAALIGAVQGSGTVGMITAASLIAPNISSLGVSPLYLACAAFGGAMAIRWMNDSGFWVSTLVANLKLSGGFKTYSAVCGIMSVVSLIVTYLLSLVWATPFGL